MEKEEEEDQKAITLRYQDTSYRIHNSKDRFQTRQCLEFGSNSVGVVHCQHGNPQTMVGRRGEQGERGIRVITVNQRGFTSVICNIL